MRSPPAAPRESGLDSIAQKDKAGRGKQFVFLRAHRWLLASGTAMVLLAQRPGRRQQGDQQDKTLEVFHLHAHEKVSAAGTGRAKTVLTTIL